MNEQKKAYRKILREFRRYKRKQMISSTKEEIWEACGKIHFYCCLKEYFQYKQDIPRGYLCLVLELAEPISAMWQFYLREEHTMYLTWRELMNCWRRCCWNGDCRKLGK